MRNIRGAGVVVFLLMAGWMAAAGRAAGVDTTDPSLPPNQGEYYGGPAGKFIYNGAGLVVVVSDIHLHPLASTTVRTASFGDEIEQFNATLNALVSVNASLTQPSTGSGQEVTRAVNKIGNTTGTFATEMLTLNLAGASPFGPYMLRESPTLASNGQTTIADIGGGLYHIDSFFDVFTELSIDGGATWMPSSGSTTLTLVMPEPGAMMILILAGGVAGIRRRRNG